MDVSVGMSSDSFPWAGSGWKDGMDEKTETQKAAIPLIDDDGSAMREMTTAISSLRGQVKLRRGITWK
jgi:hypothetical protein